MIIQYSTTAAKLYTKTTQAANKQTCMWCVCACVCMSERGSQDG